MLGFLGSGSPELEASLTLGHCIIPFLCTLVVQIGTMKCFYCPQKDVPLVPWDWLSSADQAFLWDKYPDAGEGAVCEFCVRSARPSAFFSRRSSGSSSSGPQSVDSGLLVPAVDSVAVSGECEVAESSTSAKESGAQKVPAKPSRPDTLDIQKVHSFPVHMKKKAPQTETVGPSYPPDTSKNLFWTLGPGQKIDLNRD